MLVLTGRLSLTLRVNPTPNHSINKNRSTSVKWFPKACTPTGARTPVFALRISKVNIDFLTLD
jgi:hypothetical protein